ncbi:saccharopine dehydrogenase NADP-binding domain-containing protein [Chitinivorax sp. B]|uniref:saccharopine dehydrogenase family protein n=1 Tax=Chitinivorax sp. B TaxID=2502235 RepID=UPI0010F7AD83|nr:saccharopine dehydrogenase NADP-binding domain-containing protein [Chitinivorax sp. B]
MYPILIVGAGKIGASIAKLLHHSGDYKVTVADRDPAALDRLAKYVPVETTVLDVKSPQDLARALDGKKGVLSACSFDINPGIAEAALHAGVSYFDLTEDVETTRRIRELAKEAKEGQIFMPQCGLAPGFIGILGYALAKRFDKLDSVKMRVGALPQYPHNHLKYNLTWSTDGLINEYCNPCEAIVSGKPIEVLALEGLEHFSLDGLEYEAFNTSGGLGTLCETLEGKINDLNYKTVRYPGHQYLMDFLINGLKMGSEVARRKQLKEIMENALPITRQDVVLVYVSASGWKDGFYMQETDARKIYHQDIHGEHWSSIQLTTSAGATAVIDLHRSGQLPSKGFVSQEQVDLDQFLSNRFGKYYSTDSNHAEKVKV